MSHKEKLTIVKAFAKNYRRENRKEKGELLTRLQTATGYHRKYLIVILKNIQEKKKIIRRQRQSKYLSILKPLRQLWAVSNYACGKRLIPIVPVYLDRLIAFKELTLTKKREEVAFNDESGNDGSVADP